jgi:hypothetical protein
MGYSVENQIKGSFIHSLQVQPKFLLCWHVLSCLRAVYLYFKRTVAADRIGLWFSWVGLESKDKISPPFFIFILSSFFGAAIYDLRCMKSVDSAFSFCMRALFCIHEDLQLALQEKSLVSSLESCASQKITSSQLSMIVRLFLHSLPNGSLISFNNSSKCYLSSFRKLSKVNVVPHAISY